MADTNFLTYKGKPLVRKGDEIYYGDMTEKCVVYFKILSTADKGGYEIADKVNVVLLNSNTDLAMKDRVIKESTKSSLFEALDIGFVWLERELAKG